MKIPIQLCGVRFGRLEVIEEGPRRGRMRVWLCRCSCGTFSWVQQGNLISGHTTSCGCLRQEQMSTHGKSKTKLYKVWNAMRQRCENPKVEEYKNYGGRGITVCARWLDFSNFYVDMGEPPKGRTLERKKNERGYSKENCVWATLSEQMNNTRLTVRVTYQGKTQSAKQWAAQLNLNYPTLMGRIRRGWEPVRALTEPIGKYKKELQL